MNLQVNLIKKNAEIVVDLLENISQENSMSVVMITHDEKLAKRFSKIIKLEGGKLV